MPGIPGRTQGILIDLLMTGGSYTAKQLVQVAASRGHVLNLATVYRNLANLQAQDRVAVVEIDHVDHFRQNDAAGISALYDDGENAQLSPQLIEALRTLRARRPGHRLTIQVDVPAATAR